MTILFRLFLLVTLSGGLCLSSLAGESPRPNIVLIMTDDQSPIPVNVNDLDESHAYGAYGGQVYTPHIDRLAAGGIRFDRANVVSTVCTASRYSFLTGRYASRSLGPRFLAAYPPGRVSRPGNMVELDPPGTQPNLAQVLQANGYRTGFVGKSHIIRHDLLRKPQETWSAAGLKTYPQDADPYDPEISAALAHNHDTWAGWMKDYGFDFVDGIYSGNLLEQFLDGNNHHHLEWTVSKALQFLEGSREQPFFLYFATTIPHGPAPQRRDGTRFPFGLDGDINITPEGILKPDYGFMPSRATIRAQNKAAGYPDELAYMTWFDAGVGAILQKLKDIGASDNTLVILTSDHGSWRKGKATLYEGGLRVPMITHWPATNKKGRSYDGLISSIDIAPTVLDVAGIKPQPGTLDGQSFRAVLEGSSEPVRDVVFAEIGWARAVKTKDWKYIALRYPERVNKRIAAGRTFENWKDHTPLKRPYYSPNANLGFYAAQYNPNYFETDQLYHLKNDPGEEHNLVKTQPAVAAAMRKHLENWLGTFPQRPFGEFTQ